MAIGRRNGNVSEAVIESLPEPEPQGPHRLHQSTFLIRFKLPIFVEIELKDTVFKEIAAGIFR